MEKRTDRIETGRRKDRRERRERKEGLLPSAAEAACNASSSFSSGSSWYSAPRSFANAVSASLFRP